MGALEATDAAATMNARAQSRIGGAFFIVLGALLVAWNEYDVRTEGRYGVKSAFLGPFAMVLGLGMALHAPPLPIRGGWRERAYTVAAVLAGLVNLYRYGAFHGEETRVPLLFAIGAVGVYSAYEWIKARKVV